MADGHADEHGGAGRTQHAEMISKRQNNTFFRRQADNNTDAAAHFPIYIKFESVRLELIFIKSGETRKKQDNYTICQMKCKGRTPMPYVTMIIPLISGENQNRSLISHRQRQQLSQNVERKN